MVLSESGGTIRRRTAYSQNLSEDARSNQTSGIRRTFYEILRKDAPSLARTKIYGCFCFGRKFMKPVKLALLGLYLNLFLIILLLVCFIGEVLFYGNPHWSNWVIVVLIVISGIFNFIIAVTNIINSITLFKNSDHVSLRQNMKTLKFGLVPYFVINFYFIPVYLFDSLCSFARYYNFFTNSIIFYNSNLLYIFSCVIHIILWSRLCVDPWQRK